MGQDSTIYVGLERGTEQFEQQLLKGSLAQFHVLAQRVMWGVTQADVLRVSVPAACAQLRQKFPQAPVALALSAYGARARGQEAEAQGAPRTSPYVGGPRPPPCSPDRKR